MSMADTLVITRDYNVMFGMIGFHIKNDNFISWNITLTLRSPSTQLQITVFFYSNSATSSLKNCGVGSPPSISWNIMTPAMMMFAPGDTLEITPNLTCQACFYDCYRCLDGTVCSSCN